MINTSGQALIYLTTYMIQQGPFPGLISLTLRWGDIEIIQNNSPKTWTHWNFHEIDFHLKKKRWGGGGFCTNHKEKQLNGPQSHGRQARFLTHSLTWTRIRQLQVYINIMTWVTSVTPLPQVSSMVLKFCSDVLIHLYSLYIFTIYSISDSERTTGRLQCRAHT